MDLCSIKNLSKTLIIKIRIWIGGCTLISRIELCSAWVNLDMSFSFSFDTSSQKIRPESFSWTSIFDFFTVKNLFKRQYFWPNDEKRSRRVKKWLILIGPRANDLPERAYSEFWRGRVKNEKERGNISGKSFERKKRLLRDFSVFRLQNKSGSRGRAHHADDILLCLLRTTKIIMIWNINKNLIFLERNENESRIWLFI